MNNPIIYYYTNNEYLITPTEKKNETKHEYFQ